MIKNIQAVPIGSLDGKVLADTVIRDDLYNIRAVSFVGGTELRLTAGEVIDVGPDYSVAGERIFFNSERSGLMKIRRIKPKGSEPAQITFVVPAAAGFHARLQTGSSWFSYPVTRASRDTRAT